MFNPMEATCEGGSSLQVNRPTLEEELKQKRDRLETNLKVVNRTLELLAQNETLAEFHNLFLQLRNM